MAGKPIRVLYRFMFGLPARQASEEARDQRVSLSQELFKKWKASGVKLIGYFATYGNAVDGFCHHMILEVDELDKVQEMAVDIQDGEIGRFIERFDFHVGSGFEAQIEEFWESA